MPDRIEGVKDLTYDPGFSLIKKIIDEHVDKLTDSLTRDVSLDQEKVKNIIHEIQVLRSVSELPEIVEDKILRSS